MRYNIRKRTFGYVHPAKSQTSLRIRVVWSESSLSAFCIRKVAKLLHAEYEDSDQTAHKRRIFSICSDPLGCFLCFTSDKRHIVGIYVYYWNVLCISIKSGEVLCYTVRNFECPSACRPVRLFVRQRFRISCPLYNSDTVWNSFTKFYTKVKHHRTMCRTHEP